MKSIVIVVIIMLLFVDAASATTFDDAVYQISNLKNQTLNSLGNIKILSSSIPGVTSQTVTCNNGASCGLQEQDWVVNMNVMSTSQVFDLTLPGGTTSITADGNYQVTTAGAVTIEVTQQAPIQTIPVVKQTTLQYPIPKFLGLDLYTVDAYTRAGSSSTITTRYGIQLLSATGNSPVIQESYDYRNPQTVRLSDNSGHTAIIQPSHQNNGGFVNDAASIIYVNNGYGTYEAYDSVSFNNAYSAAWTQYNGRVDYWNSPQNWAAWMTAIKAKGAVQFTDVPFVIQGNNVVYTFPPSSIGTELQAVIPQAMVSSISVRLNWGQPRIDSIILSPTTIQLGQGLQTLSAKVTNTGSSDQINVAVIVNGATVTCNVCTLTLAQNQQGMFIFSILPTVSVADGSTATITLQLIATAGGSGIQDKRTFSDTVQGKPKQDCTWYGTCAATTQKVTVTAYQPDGKSVLSNAPIYYNTNQQVTPGTWTGDLPFGTYVFSTNNATNTGMFAPSPVTVILAAGNPPAVVSLFFTSTPTPPPNNGNDYTWAFWIVVGLVISFVASRFIAPLQHPVIMVAAGIVIGVVIWGAINVVTGIYTGYLEWISNPWNPLHYL
jgi:hypothetical protein